MKMRTLIMIGLILWVVWLSCRVTDLQVTLSHQRHVDSLYHVHLSQCAFVTQDEIIYDINGHRQIDWREPLKTTIK